jgi:hypothetical protein
VEQTTFTFLPLYQRSSAFDQRQAPFPLSRDEFRIAAIANPE